MPKNRLYMPVREEVEIKESGVRIGSTVVVNLDRDRLLSITIAPPNNGNLDLGTISSDTPLAKAILGHRAGEIVSYSVGDQIHSAKIIRVLI